MTLAIQYICLVAITSLSLSLRRRCLSYLYLLSLWYVDEYISFVVCKHSTFSFNMVQRAGLFLLGEQYVVRSIDYCTLVLYLWINHMKSLACIFSAILLSSPRFFPIYHYTYLRRSFFSRLLSYTQYSSADLHALLIVDSVRAFFSIKQFGYLRALLFNVNSPF